MSDFNGREKARQLHYSEFVTRFVQLYRNAIRSPDKEQYERDRLSFEFERDLNYLLGRTHEAAVVPFTYELNSLREASLTNNSLRNKL